MCPPSGILLPLFLLVFNVLGEAFQGLRGVLVHPVDISVGVGVERLLANCLLGGVVGVQVGLQYAKSKGKNEFNEMQFVGLFLELENSGKNSTFGKQFFTLPKTQEKTTVEIRRLNQ